MPQDGMVWRHVTIHIKNSWLPGDPRGFRNRKHRLHSSGDYKNPPPKAEHQGLHAYNKDRAGDKRRIKVPLRETVGRAMVEKLLSLGYRLLVLAVTSDHVHLLIELPRDPTMAKRVVGQAKGVASRRVTEILPGQIWSEGGDYRIIKDYAHQKRAFNYIKHNQGDDAYVWTYESEVLPPKPEASAPDPSKRPHV